MDTEDEDSVAQEREGRQGVVGPAPERILGCVRPRCLLRNLKKSCFTFFSYLHSKLARYPALPGTI